MERKSATLLALLAGISHALSFTPDPSGREQCLSMVLLLLIWLLQRPSGPWADLRVGFSFGLGWFTAGVYWTYISMHDHGGMPVVLAAAATALFAAYLALFPALSLWASGWLLRRLTADTSAPAGALAARLAAPGPSRSPWLAAVATPAVLSAHWVLAEWLRGVLFTGFPWLAIGYAHIDGPLAQFAPVFGVLGVDGAVAWVAAALAVAIVLAAPALTRRVTRALLWPAMGLAVLAVAVVGIGKLLEDQQWGEPIGTPLRVRLLQGNVPQDMKFDPAASLAAMRDYTALANEPSTLGPLDLIVFPETAWTLPWSMTPPAIVAGLFPSPMLTGAESDSPRRHLAIGMPLPALIQAPLPAAAAGLPGRRPVTMANSVLLIAGPDARPIAQYDKSHLVPFGEFVPWGFRWFVDLMHIPLGDFGRGAADQAPIPLGDQQIAFNICYEDLFGAERLPAVRAGASVLVNLSNIGWFGDSSALPQHLAISRMRALETARPMLRATNTGVTASIDASGRVRASAAPFTLAFVDDEVQGMQGLTPYARWGDLPALGLALLWGLSSLVVARRTPRRP